MSKATVQCYLMVPTTDVQQSLRRYSFGYKQTDHPCTSPYGHDASVVVEPTSSPVGENLACGDFHRHDDARWPRHCEHCGYEFREGDQWQLMRSRIYQCADDPQVRFVFGDFCEHPGMMFFADWLEEHPGSVHHQEQGGGPHLCVVCPDGNLWDIDAKSTNGSGWTRTGTPPNITAHPSIQTYGTDSLPSYHGWLRNGVFEEC